MRTSACSNAEAWISAAATVSGEALGGPTTVRLPHPIRPRFSPSKLLRARSMDRSTAEKRASSLTAPRSDDLAIKAFKDRISSGVICKGKILKETSRGFVQLDDISLS